MTIIQLEYIITLDTYRNFSIAAGKCFVTQPTLSMQIQKLEEELGVLIFDRSQKPVVPTPIGKDIIHQARQSLKGIRQIKDMIRDQQNDISGNIRIGMIPTLTPYLLPLFVSAFLEKYPDVNLIVEEALSEQLLVKLNQDLLDIALLATPLQMDRFVEMPLFYEAFVVYISPQHPLAQRQMLNINDLNLQEMLLLSEGHCFHNQVVNICPDQQEWTQTPPLQFKSSSLETLKTMVERHNHYTLLPELATLKMNRDEQSHIRHLLDPKPIREVSMVVHQSYLKNNLLKVLKQEVLAHIPAELQDPSRGTIIPWK